jgi:hypothetical protein
VNVAPDYVKLRHRHGVLAKSRDQRIARKAGNCFYVTPKSHTQEALDAVDVDDEEEGLALGQNGLFRHDLVQHCDGLLGQARLC